MSLVIISSHELSALAKGYGAMEGVLRRIANPKQTSTVSECRKAAKMALQLADKWMAESEALRKKDL